MAIFNSYVSLPEGSSFVHPLMTGWWCNVPILKNDGVKVNGKKLYIPYMMENKIHVPNHQPVSMLRCESVRSLPKGIAND
jgi:hypothetical protein